MHGCGSLLSLLNADRSHGLTDPLCFCIRVTENGSLVLCDAYYKVSGSRTLTALILTIHNRQYRVYEFRIGYDPVILLLSPGLYLWVRWLCVDFSFSSIKQNKLAKTQVIWLCMCVWTVLSVWIVAHLVLSYTTADTHLS